MLWHAFDGVAEKERSVFLSDAGIAQPLGKRVAKVVDSRYGLARELSSVLKARVVDRANATALHGRLFVGFADALAPIEEDELRVLT